MADFKESEHPRDKDGKFTKKGAIRKEVIQRLRERYAKRQQKRFLTKIRKIAQNRLSKNKISLPDETLPKSVGAKWGNYEIVMPDGSIARFVKGSKIQDKEVFAGYGTRTPIRMVDWLNKKYGVKSNKWQKIKAKARIENNGEEVFAEVHWYEENTVGKVEFKFKKYL